MMPPKKRADKRMQRTYIFKETVFESQCPHLDLKAERQLSNPVGDDRGLIPDH